MLHIKDIEAFARINEALAHSSEGGSLFGGTDAHQRRLTNPALAFARLSSGMMAPAFRARTAEPVAVPVMVTQPPAPADTASDEDEAEAARVAASTPSVDSIPMATADVLPFLPRRRGGQDDTAHAETGHADTLARTGYDFDLMPPRPMTAFFNRFFFKR